MKSVTLATALLWLGIVAACGGPADESEPAAGGEAGEAPPAATATDARAEAEQIFATRCAVCHGPEGRGDGPGSAALDPAPRDYHDPAWQDSVTDQEIESVIMYGGAAIGLSPTMVANPDLVSKPEVVAALREIIREFGREN